MTRKKIVIATGGTGGHIFPALSLANYLKNHDYSIELITDKRGLRYLKDYDKVNLKEIPSSPLIKKNISRFLLSILVIVYSIMRTFLYFIFNRPSIVFGMGGYSSFPICIAASILRIKFIIYENNLIIGKANRYLLPLTKNGSSRWVPLTKKAMDILDQAPRTTDRVFPITDVALRQSWERLRNRANLIDFTFHDLRHEAISRMFEKGLNVPEVA